MFLLFCTENTLNPSTFSISPFIMTPLCPTQPALYYANSIYNAGIQIALNTKIYPFSPFFRMYGGIQVHQLNMVLGTQLGGHIQNPKEYLSAYYDFNNRTSYSFRVDISSALLTEMTALIFSLCEIFLPIMPSISNLISDSGRIHMTLEWNKHTPWKKPNIGPKISF
ncbi:MAG: hypothetical protein H6850_02835 [Alphaproteobacteria bacterium]|nr:MAG: hypothetical protein H6850_02835 [Alphaproteobacteria bacterium]